MNIEYLDFYMSQNTISAIDVLKKSNNEKIKNDDYCKFFIDTNRFGEISIENNLSEIEVLMRIFSKLVDSIDLSSVDFFFFCKNPYGQTQGNINIPFLLHKKFAMSATIVNIFQECSTTIQAMEFAMGLISNGTARKVLIVSLSHIGNYNEQRYIETSILGDGIGVMLLGNGKPCYKVLDFASAADGQYSLSIYEGKENHDPILALKNCAIVVSELSKKAGKSMEEIAMMIPQNVSYTNIHLVSKYLKLPLNRFYCGNLSCGGHMADVDTIRNLYSTYTQDTLKPSEYLICYAIGNMRPGFDTISNAVLLQKT